MASTSPFITASMPEKSAIPRVATAKAKAGADRGAVMRAA